MPWINPIYWREETDVDKVKAYDEIGYRDLRPDQKLEWMSMMIGALNAVDLNRIEIDEKYIASLINLSQNNKTDWNMLDIFGESDSHRIIDNLNDLLMRFELQDAPEVPDLPLNVYTKINDIEKLLMMMYDKFFSHVELQNFITNEDEDFLTNSGEEFIVHDNMLEAYLMTNEDEEFMVNDKKYIVAQLIKIFSAQIP